VWHGLIFWAWAGVHKLLHYGDLGVSGSLINKSGQSVVYQIALFLLEEMIDGMIYVLLTNMTSLQPTNSNA